MNIELKNLSIIHDSVKESDGLYLPDFKFNVFKLRHTFEDLLGISESEHSLLKEKNIKRLLSDRGCMEPKNIIHFTIDSLGYNQINKNNGFFDKYYLNNEVIQLSSVFPTITSTIMSSIHSGLPPEVHGLLGHKIYFPEIGNIIDTLNLNVPNAYDRKKDALIKSGINPKVLMWKYNPPSWQNTEDYKQYNFLNTNIAMSGLSHFMLEPDSVIPFRNYIDGLEKIRKLLKRKEKFYIHFYIGDVDDLSHGYGPFSEEFSKGLNLIEYILSNFLMSLKKEIGEETLISISADHGQNTIEEEKQIILKEEDVEKLQRLCYAPMGKSGRILHFYAKKEMENKLEAFLNEKISEAGLVTHWNNKLKSLFSCNENFGRLKERLGEIMVLLKPNYSLEQEKLNTNQTQLFDKRLKGHHGSLSKDELIVPFIIDKISNFKSYL
ncbi:MAG: hypothetical protein GF317_06865 [Candidatus Lokiarchaeota archaeon]|nr:hypothetical protein [Candidatus Lokiarchaeota archaeon]MBD3199431.1 hypothetical protein [Candidatus Lokiarchaeota archaeon]